MDCVDTTWSPSSIWQLFKALIFETIQRPPPQLVNQANVRLVEWQGSQHKNV